MLISLVIRRPTTGRHRYWQRSLSRPLRLGAFNDEMLVKEPLVLLVLVKTSGRQHGGNENPILRSSTLIITSDIGFPSIDAAVHHHETRGDDCNVGTRSREQLGL